MRTERFVASLEERTGEIFKPLVEAVLCEGFPVFRFETAGVYYREDGNSSSFYPNPHLTDPGKSLGEGFFVAGFPPGTNLEYLNHHPVAAFHAIGRVVRAYAKHAVPYNDDLFKPYLGRMVGLKAATLIIDPRLSITWDPRIKVRKKNPFSNDGPLPIFETSVKTGRCLSEVPSSKITVSQVDLPLQIKFRGKSPYFDKYAVEQAILRQLKEDGERLLASYLGGLGIENTVKEKVLRTAHLLSIFTQ